MDNKANRDMTSNDSREPKIIWIHTSNLSLKHPSSGQWKSGMHQFSSMVRVSLATVRGSNSIMCPVGGPQTVKNVFINQPIICKYQPSTHLLFIVNINRLIKLKNTNDKKSMKLKHVNQTTRCSTMSGADFTSDFGCTSPSNNRGPRGQLPAAVHALRRRLRGC